MKSFTKLPAIRNVEIYLQPFAGDYLGWMLDNGFNEKITSILLCCNSLGRQYIAVMDHVIDVCQKLTEFGSDVFRVESGLMVTMASASRLFGNKELAVQLRKLWLNGEMPHDLLNAIFENCLGLEFLSVDSCGALNDEHLIEWSRQGARPIKLSFIDCDGISDQGIVPILKNSGRWLKEFRCYSPVGSSKVTKLMWMMCFEYCRYARSITGYMDDDVDGLLSDALASKCFYKPGDYQMNNGMYYHVF